ncbi:MAG: DNA pilot protein [Microvirus sp.]|nr:MAG: DNA pilot protein [Microvirus sp.]
MLHFTLLNWLADIAPILGSIVGGPIGSVIGIGASFLDNKLTQNRQDDVYRAQRGDAISDREYNSPKNQMARLKEAGLNPNLVYGNGADVAVQNTRPSTYTTTPVTTGAGITGALSQFVNLQKVQAETDNLRAQKELILADREYREHQSTGLGIDNSLKSALYQNSLEMAHQDLLKKQADTQFTLDSNDRAAASNAMTIKEGLQRIIESRMRVAKDLQEIQNLKKSYNLIESDNRIRQLDIDVKEKGGQPHDSFFFRKLNDGWNYIKDAFNGIHAHP